jgi:flagellar hook-associated protein 2
VATQTGAAGQITSRMNSDDTTLKGFTDQIAKLTARQTSESERLKKQFAAMETALNNSQAQQAWLSGQIASLGF